MKNWKLMKFLLYIVPFVNIFNNRGGSTIITILIGIVSLMIFFTSDRKLYNYGEKKVLGCGRTMVGVVLLMTLVTFLTGIDNYESIRFFCLFPFFVLLLIRVDQMDLFIKTDFIKYLRFLIILMTTSIIVDYMLMSANLLTMQPMYNENNFSYHTRPFGLFGQPSVNSCLLCLFYIMHRAIVKRYQINYKRDWLFIIMLIGCIVQGSGSGFISLAIAILCKYGAKKRVNFSLKRVFPYLIIAITVLIVIILSNKVDKLSLNYIEILIDFTKYELWDPYVQAMGSPVNLWFGLKHSEIGIDFGPLYLISTVGLFYFIAMTFFSFHLFKRARSLEMKCSILLLLIGNLHYPVMFYFIMNVMWFFIIYYILVNENNNVCRI